MAEFFIPNAAGSGGLLFYQRSPTDPAERLDTFWVRVMGLNLSASVQVYAGVLPSHPACLFADMSRQWSGWEGELVWESLERELVLRCTHDRQGHISICAELRAGPMLDDWMVSATVVAEAGQLEGIARRAASFFGQSA